MANIYAELDATPEAQPTNIYAELDKAPSNEMSASAPPVINTAPPPDDSYSVPVPPQAGSVTGPRQAVQPVIGSAKDAWDLINTPIIDVKPPEEQVKLFEHGTPIEQRALGVREGLDNFLSSLTSPLSVGTLGIAGALKGAPMLAKALSVAFAAQMGKHLTGDVATELGNEMGKPKGERDDRKIAQLLTESAAITPMVTHLGHDVLAPKPNVSTVPRNPMQQVLAKNFQGERTVAPENQPTIITPQPVDPVETPAPIATSKTVEAPAQPSTAAKPAEAPPQDPTSIKNAVIDQERAARGVAPAFPVLRKAFGEVWDRAMKRINANGSWQGDLIAELKEKPRAITDEEDAAILHRQVELQNEYGKASKQLADMVDSGNTEGLDDVKAKINALSDQLQDVYNVGKNAGTETARGLNARKMMVNEDFTLAQMELTKRAEKGGKPLTDAERTEITKLHEKIAKTQKAYDDYVAASQEKISKLEADKKVAEMKADAAAKQNIPPKVVEIAKKIVERFNREGDAAALRLKDRLSRTSALVDPLILRDVAEVAAKHIANGVESAAKFTIDLVAEYGENIRPYAEKAWKLANDKLNNASKEFGAAVPAVKKAVKSMTPDDQQSAIEAQIKAKSQSGDNADYGYQIQKLAKHFVEQGITDRDKLVDAVHAVVSHADPEMTRRDTMDAISGYGKYKQLTKDQVSVKLRDLKGQLQQVGKLDDMMQGIPPKKTGVEHREPSKEEADLIKQVNDFKKKYNIQTVDPATELKSALDELKKRLSNKTAEFEERLAKGDFAKKTPRVIPLDKEAIKLKAQNEKAKDEWRRGREVERLKARTRTEKAVDFLSSARRAAILSSPTVIPKLAGAAAARLAITPLEEGAGGILSKIPGIRNFAANAPREGGFSAQAEKASLGSLGNGLVDAFQVLKSGKSNIDTAAGVGKHVQIPGKIQAVMDFPGRVHQAIKEPVRRAEFERSFIKRSMWNDARGVNIADPIENMRITREALGDADRAVFKDKNRVATYLKAAPNFFKNKGKPTMSSEAVKLAMNTEFPIKNVPFNIASEALNYLAGAPIGLFKTGLGKSVRSFHSPLKVMAETAKTLTPEESDQVMRHLKKGLIGPAAVLIGWYAYKNVGGFHERGEKREEGEPKAGETKISGVTIPKEAQHHPWLEDVQFGSTAHRVAEEIHKGEPRGKWEGGAAATIGLLEETPILRETFDIAQLQDPNRRSSWAQDHLKNIVIPQLLQWEARREDKDAYGNPVKRYPKTFPETLKTGIPGLRKDVSDTK